VRRPRRKCQERLSQKDSADTTCGLLKDVEQRWIAGWYQILQDFKQDRDAYNWRQNIRFRA